MNKVKYENKTIAYTVNRAKIKNFYITIQNGEVVIKAPRFATSSQIQNVVEAKRQWIMQKLQEYQQSPSKVKEYNFHVLRHTFATNCIKVGMDIKSLSEVLGHASVDVTLNRYVHSSYEMKKKFLEKL